MASNATLTIKVGANVRDAAQQLQALGYNIESVKKKTDKANDSASLWSQTMKKGSEDSVRKIVEMGAKFLTVSTVITGVYKGIKSCVSEALKENEEAQKKIDKINEAWTGVQKNLGNALLDSITPALETLYTMLLKLEEWTKKFSTNAGRSSFINAVATATKDGGTYDSSGNTLVELEGYLDYLEKELPASEYNKHSASYDRVKAYLKSEIEVRKASISSTTDPGSLVDGSTIDAGSGISLGSILEEADSLWENYFSSIYSYGQECFSSLSALVDQYYTKEINAIKNSEATEEEKNAKINELEKKQFQAEQINSYSEATMSYAQGLIDIWSKYGASPWIGAALTALLTANTGLQFATISQQTYTPSLAEGGIVTSPTHAYIGEGAEHEAVIPLSKLEDFVNRDSEGGAIYLNITCNGNSSEADVFRAIERAQRTGLLPHWRYA